MPYSIWRPRPTIFGDPECKLYYRLKMCDYSSTSTGTGSEHQFCTSTINPFSSPFAATNPFAEHPIPFQLTILINQDNVPSSPSSRHPGDLHLCLRDLADMLSFLLDCMIT